MTYAVFKERWTKLTESQKQRVRDKSNWEHMSLWAVMNEWYATEDPVADTDD